MTVGWFEGGQTSGLLLITLMMAVAVRGRL